MEVNNFQTVSTVAAITLLRVTAALDVLSWRTSIRMLPKKLNQHQHLKRTLEISLLFLQLPTARARMVPNLEPIPLNRKTNAWTPSPSQTLRNPQGSRKQESSPNAANNSIGLQLSTVKVVFLVVLLCYAQAKGLKREVYGAPAKKL